MSRLQPRKHELFLTWALTLMKKILLTLIATVATLTACNDADYKIIENGAYINESLSAKSAKVIITDEGGSTEITPCLSSAAPKDCKFRLEVD